MEQRLTLVTLGVVDLEVSLHFYAALGWKRGNKNPAVVFFQLNGMILGAVVALRARRRRWPCAERARVRRHHTRLQRALEGGRGCGA